VTRPRTVERRRPDRRNLFLAEISRTLLESIDYDETLDKVARLAMPELGAWCIVDVFDAAGEMRRLAVHHPDPARRRLVDELERQYPPSADDLIGAPRVSRTQQPELVSEVTTELLESISRDRRHQEILSGLGFCSYMIVPLKARGRLLGAITFIAATDAQSYSPRDLLFAEDVAARAASAMDNARLYMEAHQAREEAVAAVARATIADRAKTDFLATMSHELRTPLNAIAGYAELLELGMRGPITDQQREAIRRIRKSQSHLLGIVNDILTLAKTETGRIPVNLENIPVAAAIESARFLVQPLMEENALTFSAEECDPALSVVADQDRMQQVLVNVLSNAAKFSRRGGAVTVRCEVRDHLVAILVIDSGRGIDPSMHEAIFEPFVQLSTGLTRTADGSGLGLPISRELARLMGGDVTVESARDKGATFTLLLPLSAPVVPVL
jgi:signal transduction histidine kinase